MPPVAAAVIAVGSAIAGAVGAVVSAVSAVAAWSVGSFSVGRFLLTVGLNLAFNKLSAPKAPAASVTQRQASVLELTIGESPRQAVFGRAATGGSLVDAFNFGETNQWEMLVIDLADHQVTELVGYFVNDKYVAHAGDGPVTLPDFVENGGSFLSVHFWNGAPGQVSSDYLRAHAPDRWSVGDAFTGCAYVVVSYHVNERIWSSGRPRFRFVLRGAPLYDPRLDSTVPGGAGAQRWDQPHTWTWSENAALAHYNFIRGIWSNGQLMVGPGRSEEEAPPADIIAAANVCDELVALKAGGNEARYKAGCVVSSDEEWITVEENFAAAMAGDLVERAGAIAVDPGVAQSAVFTFGDDDLLVGEEIRYQAKVTRDQLVNTVSATYVAPDQLWETASAPLRRSLADITADGEAREQSLSLPFVTSQTQAQRIAEIQRRKARMQAQATVALGPKYMRVEVGDWCTWTSERYFGGDGRTFQVVGVAHDEACNVKLALRAIGASAFGWTPATDEIDADQPAYLEPGAPPVAVLQDFDAVAQEIAAAGAVSAGAILATWTPPTDGSIVFVDLEYRPFGSTTSSTVRVDATLGAYLIAVLPIVDVDYEIRATPVTRPVRDALTTAWRFVALSAPLVLPTPPANFTGYRNRDLIRFVWLPFLDTSLRYEIRSGETFDLGQYVDNVAGGSTTVQWPTTNVPGDQVLFWIKTIHRSGLYSETATLWVSTVAEVGDRNFVLAEDFQEDDFPGIRHALTETVVDDLAVLELAAMDEGLSATRGDYYQQVSLIDTFKARTWIEQRASAFFNDVPAWEDTEATWDELGEADWSPDIGNPGGAKLDSFIAVNAEDPPAALVEGWRLNETLAGLISETPTGANAITYAPARADLGARVGDGGILWYELTVPAEFSLVLDVRVADLPDADAILLTLSNAGGDWLQLWWRETDATFVLDGSDTGPVEIAFPLVEDDTLSIGLWQSDGARGLGIGSRVGATPFTAGDAETTGAAAFTGLSIASSSLESVEWDDTEDTWGELDAAWGHYTFVGPTRAGFPGVFGDVAIYTGATEGAAFSARWERRGPIGFADFDPFIAGDYVFQDAVVWMRLTAPQAFSQTLSITRAKVNVDVPDVVDRGEVDIDATGEWISFGRDFYEPPSVTATQRSGATRGVVVVEQIERTRFFARMYVSDDPTTGLAGALTYAANGF